MARLPSLVLIGALFAGSGAGPAFGQTPQTNQQSKASGNVSRGTVVSSTSSTLVIKTEDGQYELFVLNSNTARPTIVPLRSTVAISSYPSEEVGAPIALVVSITGPAPAADTPVGTTGTVDPAQEAIPPGIRQTERAIQRTVQRYRIGVRASAALDPELVSIGAQGQIGPLFQENFWARPNVDFAFGEVTTLISLNFDGSFRLPVTSPQARWALFVGAGPALNFQNRGFNEGESRFNDFDFDFGLNIFLGMQLRSGMFVELRGTAYAAPSTRFVIGYNF